MEYTTLDKISENLDSKRKPITSSDRVEGEIPYYGASGIVDYVKDYIFDEVLLLVSEDGANLLARSTPIAFSVSGKTWINNHAHVLRFSNKNLQKFVEIYLNSISLESYVTGSAQPKLNQKMLNEIPIPVVEDSQIEIVVNLAENLKSIIELRKQELSCFDDLIKARFVEMFGDAVANPKGWSVKKLKELSVQINSGNTPKGGSENYVEEGITFFRSQNVWKDRLEMEDIAYIDDETHASMKRSSLKHGDILMTKTGRINTENSSLGRAALYLGEDDKANVNGHVYFIRLKPGVNNRFILRILVSPEYRDLIRGVCVGGIDKRQLNKEHIEDFPIICPPSDMVDEYVAVVDQVDKSKVIDMINLLKILLFFKRGMYYGN